MNDKRKEIINAYLEFSLLGSYIEKKILREKKRRKKSETQNLLLKNKNSQYIIKHFEDFINSPYFTNFELRLLNLQSQKNYTTEICIKNSTKEEKENLKNKKLLELINKILKISKSLNLSQEQKLELNKLLNLLSTSKNNLNLQKIDFFINNLSNSHFLDFKHLKFFIYLILNS